MREFATIKRFKNDRYCHDVRCSLYETIPFNILDNIINNLSDKTWHDKMIELNSVYGNKRTDCTFSKGIVTFLRVPIKNSEKLASELNAFVQSILDGVN